MCCILEYFLRYIEFEVYIMKISKVILVASFLMVQYGYCGPKFTNEHGFEIELKNAAAETHEEVLELVEEDIQEFKNICDSIEEESKNWEAAQEDSGSSNSLWDAIKFW